MNKLERMHQLIDIITEHNYNYYVLDNPTIPDVEYDKLYYELVDLEQELNLVLPSSPTQRVGDNVLESFKKHTHQVRLYSLNKIRDFDALDKWMQEMRAFDPDTDFSLEYKFDGLQLVLEYQNGVLQNATTRGNGLVGEDVTLQVKTIKSVPLKIKYTKKLLVQGEGMMTLSNFYKYNKTADEPLKNPRNGVAGAIRNLDPKQTAKRNLDMFCYSILYIEDDNFDTQQQMHDFLLDNGFKVGDFFKIAHTHQEIVDTIQQIDKQKDHIDIMIDGMVIKVNNIKFRQDVGYTSKYPKWAMAYKFEAVEVASTLQQVNWQVGRTGKVTPIAIIEPVELAGATVTRATLNNYDDILRKKVKLNSKVFVRRSNEVIPEILGLAQELENSQPIPKPTTCPSCGATLEQIGPNLFCPNQDGCREQVIGKLAYFGSRNCMNIEGFSDKTAAMLYDNLNVRKISDLYNLSTQDLKTLEGFKDKKIANLINAINSSKTCNLNNLLDALSINGVGEKTSKDLARYFGSLENIINATAQDLTQVKDVGEIIANNIVAFFEEEETQQLLNDLLQVITINNPLAKATKDGIFSGKKFVLTGTLQGLTRDQASAIIEQNGGEVVSSVSKNTDYVLAGDNAGSKLDKAQALGVTVISQDDFEKLLKN